MNHTKKFISIGGAAKLLGVSVETLRRWESIGKLVPVRTPAGHRRYDTRLLKMPLFEPASNSGLTVAYARVLSHRETADLKRQEVMLAHFCTERGWRFELVSEVISGMNAGNTGLKRLLDEIIAGRIERLVLPHRDALFRIGADLIFTICEIKQVEVVILNRVEGTADKEDIGTELEELVTLLSSRLYPVSPNWDGPNDARRPVPDLAQAV